MIAKTKARITVTGVTTSAYRIVLPKAFQNEGSWNSST
jgi:hypothetical protein